MQGATMKKTRSSLKRSDAAMRRGSFEASQRPSSGSPVRRRELTCSVL